MKNVAGFIAFFCVSLSASAYAQDASPEQGRKLFYQSCGVCHTKPTITAPLYGPALSKDTLGGDAGAMVDFISLGTAKMPGFQHVFSKPQIQAIAAYLKTVPAPAPAPAK